MANTCSCNSALSHFYSTIPKNTYTALCFPCPSPCPSTRSNPARCHVGSAIEVANYISTSNQVRACVLQWQLPLSADVPSVYDRYLAGFDHIPPAFARRPLYLTLRPPTPYDILSLLLISNYQTPAVDTLLRSTEKLKLSDSTLSWDSIGSYSNQRNNSKAASGFHKD